MNIEAFDSYISENTLYSQSNDRTRTRSEIPITSNDAKYVIAVEFLQLKYLSTKAGNINRRISRGLKDQVICGDNALCLY